MSNREARKEVQNTRTFKANNLYAENINGAYVVYSYGPHWPLFIFKDGQWYENEDRYSTTTSKHRSQSHPHAETIKRSVKGMKELLYAR